MTFTASYLEEITSGILFGDPTLRISGFCIDSRKAKPGDMFIALPGERVDGHDYIAAAMENGASIALVSRKMPGEIDQLLVKDTAKALGLIARAAKEALHPLTVGVTGSVGKTTTKQLIASVLQTEMPTLFTEGNYNNELGLPLTLLRLKESDRAAVLEMGMSAFGEIAYLSEIATPDIAVVTCIGTSHIENLGSREGIRDAKMEILTGMSKDGVLILNGDEPLLAGYDAIYVGRNPKAKRFYKAENIRRTGEGMSFELTNEVGERVSDLYVPGAGEHLVIDAAMAYAVGKAAGLQDAQIKAGLCRFENTGMRQHMEAYRGMTLIIDCYNAAPESMKAALSVLKNEETTGKRLAILGDMRELGEHSARLHKQVGREAAGACDALICFGPQAIAIKEGALEGGMKEEALFHFPELEKPEEAALCLSRLAHPGDTLLFKASRGTAVERIIQAFKEI